VPLAVRRCYCSESLPHQLGEADNAAGKPVMIYQLGNHDRLYARQDDEEQEEQGGDDQCHDGDNSSVHGDSFSASGADRGPWTVLDMSVHGLRPWVESDYSPLSLDACVTIKPR
jgi:hypothetical protein